MTVYVLMICWSANFSAYNREKCAVEGVFEKRESAWTTANERCYRHARCDAFVQVRSQEVQ